MAIRARIWRFLAGVSWHRAPFSGVAAALTIAAVFLGFDLNHPIALWDESRVLSNALEMSQNGLAIITTYGWKPDLWNTKPPLAIWLIVLSLRLFGTNEWAMRLPSLIAALSTVALTMTIAWRVSRSRFATFCSAFLLVCSFGFYGYHVAWSADYDALLTFFATAYLFGFFQVLHRARPSASSVLGCAIAVALACLTKGVAGLLPGVGVAIYAVARRRLMRLFRTYWYALAALGVVIVVGGFYFMREQASPGYLNAVRRMELGGRYLSTVNGHRHFSAYYVVMLLYLFSVPPALLALVIAPWLRWPNGRAKAFVTYGLFVCASFLVIVSLSQTKIFWYLAPILPMLSVLAALALDHLLASLSAQSSHWAKLRVPLIVGGAALFGGIAGAVRFVGITQFKATPLSGYGQVFADVSRAGFHRAVAVDSGLPNDDGLGEYTPLLHAYAVIWRGRGLSVGRMSLSEVPSLGPGVAVVSCDSRYVLQLRAVGATLTSAPGCVAVRAEAFQRRSIASPIRTPSSP